MMNLSYLPATEEDIEHIIFLCKSLIDNYEDLSSINYSKVLQWVERKVRENIGKYTVITLENVKVGYYCLCKADNKWELDDFYVLPQFRGRGIGTTVLTHICQNTLGCIFLYVYVKNKDVISLYERFGFVRVIEVSPTRQIMERPG